MGGYGVRFRAQGLEVKDLLLDTADLEAGIWKAPLDHLDCC